MQVLNFYDHFNSFYGGLWFKIVDDMMMLDNSRLWLLASFKRGRLFISLESWWFDWIDNVKCQYTNPRHMQRGSGRYASVWANWTNPRNWANSAAIHANYSVGTARHSEWICRKAAKSIFMKIGSRPQDGPRVWDKVKRHSVMFRSLDCGEFVV